ncbi:MAG: phosphate signaling complex protein PhoU [Candidatus Sulfomarinibacteraceae bacterium]
MTHRDIRVHFHEDLAKLEQEILSMGSMAREAVAKAVQSLVADDDDLALEVVAGDDELDRRGFAFERLWLQVMALQTPVAIDLRVMSVLQHVSHSVLRVGDQAVNIAKIQIETTDMKRKDEIVAQIKEMGELVDPMLRLSLEALERRDDTMEARLDEMDDPVDVINRAMYQQVVDCGDDPDQLAWATRMMIVSRALERVGDRAVAIAEQVVFLVRGALSDPDRDADALG